jgi:hypothetical protein
MSAKWTRWIVSVDTTLGEAHHTLFECSACACEQSEAVLQVLKRAQRLFRKAVLLDERRGR